MGVTTVEEEPGWQVEMAHRAPGYEAVRYCGSERTRRGRDPSCHLVAAGDRTGCRDCSTLRTPIGIAIVAIYWVLVGVT